MTAAAFPRSLTDQAPTERVKPLRPACSVRLVDRRTGLTHRVNGCPLVIYTRNPTDAVAELLAGRDASVWEARIEPIGGTA